MLDLARVKFRFALGGPAASRPLGNRLGITSTENPVEVCAGQGTIDESIGGRIVILECVVGDKRRIAAQPFAEGASTFVRCRSLSF